jgi:hypothetical protein
MYHQMPGVDMLGRVLCEDGMCQQFGNIRAVRELASAANQSGATRRFSETYGGGGWQVSFTDLKRLLDWECVLGVNFVNQHLSYFSMQGVRKFDYPPSFSYQEPWWDQHKLLGDYTARISMALSAGEQINKVLVLQPNTTAWMYHADGDRHGEEIHGLSVGFKEFIMQLEADQLEYDLGSEQVLKRFGSVGNNGLQVGERSYSKIIIPPGMQNLDSNTLKLLEELSGSGLELLVLSDSIDYLDGEFQKDILAKVSYSQAADLKDWFEQEDLDLSTIKGNQQVVFHQRRVLDNGELLFLVNSSASESAHLQLSWKGKNLYEVNLITGELHSINHTKNGKHIECDLFLHPVGSKLLISSDKSLENQVLKDLSSSFEGGVTIPSSSPLLASRLSDNVLTIDYLDVETKDFKISDSYFMNAMYKLFEWSELPTGNPWQHKIQFKQTYMDMDSFDTDTWHKITYMFDIAGDLSPDQLRSLKLVAERPEIWTVSINGHSVDAMADKWWLDRHFPVYSIGEFVQKGINSIELSADKMSVFAEIMPVYILGDFALKNAAKGFAIVAPEQFGTGAWNEKGLQFYSNKVAYKQSFMLDDKLKDGERCFLKTNDWQAVVTELLVNDEFVVSIAWQDQVDITDFLKAGKNTIELRLTGSLKNTLGFHHKDLTGWIDGPFSWNQAPANQPPGSDYRFMEYGIVGGIQLFIVEVE